jgi:hypothetical protein
MDNNNKPDVVMYDSFLTLLNNGGAEDTISELQDACCVYSVSSFQDRREHEIAIATAPPSRCRLKLFPIYGQADTSGNLPVCTSYFLQKPTILYRIERKNPRYIIWPKNLPCPLCCTTIDRIDADGSGLWDAVHRAVAWSGSFNFTKTQSVIVIDLDDTLINSNNQPFPRAEEMIQNARQVFDRVVIWSHGSPLHVDEYSKPFARYTDLILSTGESKLKSPKNLLSIYNSFPDALIERAVLIDDCASSWTPEYCDMIVPTGPESTKVIIETFL